MRAAFAALAAVAALTGCGDVAREQESERAVVMVSGRDDHGLLAAWQVELTSSPGGGRVVGAVADGALARVRTVRGTSVEISADGLTGWVDEFHLRGEVRLAGAPPSCVVDVAGRSYPAGTRVEVLHVDTGWATVRVIDDRRTGQVRTRSLFELPPAPGRRCPNRGTGRTR